MSNNPKFVTYVEDAEEDSGSSVEGIESTRRYAVSEAPVGPYKERPNTDSTPRSSKRDREARREFERERERERELREKDRRRKERKLQKEQAEQQAQRKARVDAKAVREQQREREQREREREAKLASRKPRPTSLTQSRTEPVVQQYRRGHVEDPSCYGVKQPAASGARPRAQTRPNSYYPGPPPSAMGPPGWHHPPPAQQAPAGYPAGSFPPPPIYGGGGPSPSLVGVPSSPAHHAPSFFDMSMQQGNAHLKTRFERPASAMGYRQSKGPSPAAYGFNPGDYDEEPEPRMTRRASRSSKKPPPPQEDDRKRMPPPEYIPRPQSAALPAAAAFRPPPPAARAEKPSRNKSRPPTARRNISFVDPHEYDDDEFDHEDLYADEPTYNRHTTLARTRRGSVAYEHQGMDIIPAGSRTRRDSFFDTRALGGGGVSLDDDDDDKYLTALAYQDDITGGPGQPLTAEALRKASTRGVGGGSSRSTRSSDSRDESEYRQSNTTGITRSSSSDNDNVTIKVSGSAVVRVQGAEIECGDGGEITFSAPTNSRVGSDRASTVYQLEDNRSRVERKALPHRARAPSQSGSHRAYPAIAYAPYDPSFAPDDYI